MFHWICPECGRECLPASRECPDCADLMEEPALVGAPALESSSTSRHGGPVGGQRPKWHSLFIPSHWMPAAPEPTLSALPRRIEPAASVAEVRVDDSIRITAEPQLGVPLPASWRSFQPLPLIGALDLSESAALDSATPTDIHLVGPEIEIAALASATCGVASALPESENPVWRPWNIASLARPVESNKALDALPLEIQPCEALLSVSRVQPSAALPEPRLQGLIAGPPRRRISPAMPPGIQRIDPAPRTTLPGVKLPRELERLQESDAVACVNVPKPHKQTPAWLITLSATVTVVVVCTVAFYVLPALQAGRAPARPSVPDVSSPVSAKVVSGPGKALEVTGFRVGIDLTNKTVIQYIVVNHSASDIAGATVNVGLKAARGRFQRSPLVSFSFQLPSIGPLESREMTTVLDTPLKVEDIPEWRTLRSEIQVTP